MPSLISDIVKGFAGLFWPDICVCCSTGLLQGEEYICSHCLYELPVTNYHAEQDNPVAKAFWGRVEVEHAVAGYFFRKGNRVQKLMHRMKYRGQKEIGEMLGKELGRSLKGTCFNEVGLIVPVPLHPEKLRRRGYNQSEWIARGLAVMMDKPVDTKTLVRHSAAGTQTRKKRFERWENINSGFGLADPDAFAGKHILLIDDVVTTGATLEACIRAVRSAQGAKVSVAALAVAAE